MKRKTVGVLLSGCGVQDGSEIHEATLTLYFLDKMGADILCMAPGKNQMDVVNHVTGSPVEETRNCLTEAARIARGEIRDVKTVMTDAIDALIIPGGFGAAKNLSTFAVDGAHSIVDGDVAALLRELVRAGKPIGALCIAPAILAALFGREFAPTLTIGMDEATAGVLEEMGARHRKAQATDIVVDEKLRIVTTPCYMMAQGIAEVGVGVEKLVARILDMIA
ncbi:MAG: isoprenoid biosynthesis glyoxalase ElbB [Acidobacteriota bacterium]|jgi:enhancing lycopene biosynthesis protein 2|nr:isoprenoid biosynthesis glyoxalase ElbB [Acidobacteriota bacterium]NLT33916.1 isoprenoid biosynthesis glyoxalase ElbB [Acidobacteriota bacterium]